MFHELAPDPLTGDAPEGARPSGAVQAGARIAGIFVVAAALWIALGDQLVARVAADVATVTLLQTLKGMAFILASGAMVGFLVYREVRERERARARVAAAAERFRQLIHNSHDIITLVDADRSILFSSAATERVLGFPPEQVVGRSAIDLLHPDDRARALTGARQLLDTGEAGSMEVRVRDSGGEWRWLKVVGARAVDGDGRTGLVLNCADVTDERRADAERANLEASLRQSRKMEAVGLLAGGVAHDFNNLLTVIGGNVEMLLDQTAEDVTGRPELEAVAGAAHAAADLTRHLLAFSRKQVLHPRPVDLNRAVTAAVPLLQQLAGPMAPVHTDLDPETGTVEVDPVQLEQVMLNLVLNARDAMPAGGAVRIRTGRRDVRAGTVGRFGQAPEPGPFATLSVGDAGAGISPEIADRIFDPFFTTKGIDGVGLGLSTVLGIVQQSGGCIDMDTGPDGTTFHVLLPHHGSLGPDADDPLTRRAEPRAVVDGGASRGQGAHAGSGRGRILVVEDEAGVRSLIRRVLERAGYQVLESDSGPAALHCLAGRMGADVDLLLTDIVMPGMHGDELARTVRRERPRLPVLFISGYMAESSLGGEILAEGVEFLPKPFKPADLTDRIRQLIG